MTKPESSQKHVTYDTLGFEGLKLHFVHLFENGFKALAETEPGKNGVEAELKRNAHSSKSPHASPSIAAPCW